jgi:hypothetical protein
MTTATAIKERPILFSGPMARAILAGRKTQTRRVAKFKPLVEGLNLGFSGLEADDQGVNGWALASRDGRGTWNERTELLRCPYGQVGDRLWVRETWAEFPSDRDWIYRADYDKALSEKLTWRPSIFMPRPACRIVLEVAYVRVQRLQRITEEDAVAEGAVHWPEIPDPHPYKQGARWTMGDVPPNTEHCLGSARFAFGNLWNKLNEKRGYGWDVNPWVWVIEFRRVS